MAGGGKPLRGRVILITGAARGIGRAAALMAARAGAIVIATARPDSLALLRRMPGNMAVLPLDVRDERQIRECLATIMRRWGRLDALVNNAAVSIRAFVEHTGHEDIREQLRTNFIGPLNLIRAVLPVMKRQGSGRIVNVSSVGGMMAMPAMGMYSATKFALEGLSESLWYECRPLGIHVSLVEPGFTRSGALERIRHSRRAQAHMAAEPSRNRYATFEAFVSRLYERFGSGEKRAARAILRALTDPRPRLRYPATPDAFFFFWMRRLLPRPLYHSLLYSSLPKGLRDGRA
ncbi:SDR family NAD(P)-dependent oxidoreductase [Candidatus Poribacteria bacterium]|nr:SDR family NAD(P)-dependent oxidoreductase [Candidatus Poribacteria bacterium]